MEEKELTGIEKIMRVINDLEDKSGEIIKFNADDIVAFVDKLSTCKTVRQVVDSTDVDNLDLMLKQIDKFYNGTITWNKLEDVMECVSSNFCFDFFAFHNRRPSEVAVENVQQSESA